MGRSFSSCHLTKFIYLGALNKLNRQFKYSNENNRLQSDKATKMESALMQVLQETRVIKKNLVQYNYHLRMDTVDISQYFPILSESQLIDFMKPDEEWNQRKKECKKL